MNIFIKINMLFLLLFTSVLASQRESDQDKMRPQKKYTKSDSEVGVVRLMILYHGLCKSIPKEALGKSETHYPRSVDNPPISNPPQPKMAKICKDMGDLLQRSKERKMAEKSDIPRKPPEFKRTSTDKE